MKIAIIGAGISGLSAGQILKDNGHTISVFDKNPIVGGLIRCEKIQGNLYHKIGGHVFNSKHEDVLAWFWKHFNKEEEFVQAKRNAKIYLGEHLIGYPIENFLYQLEKPIVEKIVFEILEHQKQGYKKPEEYSNFKDFLIGNFGRTLYELYFKPYNKKIWQTDLENVAMDWLEGKLPMPNYVEMITNSIIRQGEEKMVHSNFYYPKHEGSQFIADRFTKGLELKLNCEISTIIYQQNKWFIEDEAFDAVVYTGDIRKLESTIDGISLHAKQQLECVKNLQVHGTSNILCEFEDDNDLSWLYLPNKNTNAHRIIYTGNFSENNNHLKKTCVVEFTGKVSGNKMIEEIKKLPGQLKPLATNYESNTYVIQEQTTRENVLKVKKLLKPYNFYLHGRFAEWEYYNMDAAIKAGLDKFSNFSL